MKKLLKYLLMPILLALSLQTWAQIHFPNPEPNKEHVFFLNASGNPASLPDEEFYSCDYVPQPLSESAARDLLNLHGHIVVHPDCGELHIDVFLDKVSEDMCEAVYQEEFWGELDNDECSVYEIIARRKITVYKRPNPEYSSTVMHNGYPLRTNAACSLDDPVMTVPNIQAYVSSYMPSCWEYLDQCLYSVYYNADDYSILDNCEKFTSRTFTVYGPCSSGPAYNVIEYVAFQLQDVPLEVNSNELFPIDYWGCSEADIPRAATTVDELKEYGLVIENPDCVTEIEVTHEDIVSTTSDGKIQVQREYTLTDKCHGPDTKLTQMITLSAYLWTDGRLDIQAIPEDGELPQTDTYLNVDYIKDHGIDITYSCEDESELTVEFVMDKEYKRGDELVWVDRFYNLRCIGRDYVTPVEIKERYTIPFNPNVEEFRLEYFDCSDDATNDGTMTLIPSPSDIGCFDCEFEKSYVVFLEWTSEDYPYPRAHEYPDKDHPDPLNITDLAGGDYKLYLYANCSGVTNKRELIMEDEFKIHQGESEVSIIPWISLAAESIYCEMFSNHMLYKDYNDKNATVSNGYYPTMHNGKLMKAKNIIRDKNTTWNYSWKSDFGTFMEKCDEKGGPWSINTNMESHYASGYTYLLDLVCLKLGRGVNSPPRAMVTFNAFTGKTLDDNSTQIIKKYTRPAYYGFYNDSYDPNLISGPAGYGIDSIIAAKDRIDYRISFENSPDFATAAASRVVIKCPLHEKADSKTLRLGQFGFGDFIYDVPELSSHYSNRIDLADTLGVWLDVTAGLDIDNNEAYWIFQSIDPETGVQPNDTIGFLPVNDTLTGCGEGFVTFSIATFDDTKTGDTITEMAKIVFDENDTIPTNTCTNMFDAVAPTSILYGDTIGVSSSYYLNFKAVAQDDDGGSGIENVELFVSADKTEYVSAGFMTRDSVSDTLRMSYKLGFSTLYQFLCVAIDNVGNREAFKELHEYEYVNNNPPTDIFLSNRYFDEDAKIGDNIGTITTMDDQDSDEFEYTLVEGEGDDDNDKFTVLNDKLRVNYNFRCKDNDTYKVRIQSKDVNGDSLQKWFYLYANDVLTPDVTVVIEKLCFGETYHFGGTNLSTAGIYYDTLSTVDGCDSVVKLNLIYFPDPEITYYNAPACEGEDFEFESFVIPWDSIEDNFISTWDKKDDTLLIFKQDVIGANGCSDTLWLNMTLHPKRYDSHDVIICENGLPFKYGDSIFSEGGIKFVHFTSVDGCDSIVTLNLTVEPTYYNVLKFDTICDNQEYVILSDTITSPGLHLVYGKTEIHHCDSMVRLYLTALPTFSTVFNLNVCSSHLPIYDYEGFDTIPADATTGEMTRYETAQNGCDSIIHLNLTVRNADTQENDFDDGWNWYSTYLDLDEINGLQALEDSLGEKGLHIKSQTQFVSYTDGLGWMGSLGSITNEEMYMIQTNDTVNVDLFSCLTTGSEHPITIVKGWNWIGYVSRYANSTENALGTLTPQEGDIIKSYDQGFAVYYEMLGGWFGSLTQMRPGVGYMYYSNNETDVTLIYPNPAKDGGRQLKMPPTHWNASAGKYPTNMTFIGKITIDNIPTTTDNLEVGVFCNGEVRGSGRAILMEGLGTYRLFVQVYGDNGDELTFRLYDHRQEREHDAKSYQKVYFADNASYGSIKDPYPFKFYTKYTEPDNADVTAENVEDGGNMVGEEYNSHELTLVPNPANSSTRVLLYCDFTPEERDGLIVEVFNALGVRIQQTEPTRYPVQLKEIENAGSYMVKVTTGTGRVLTKKLVTTR